MSERKIVEWTVYKWMLEDATRTKTITEMMAAKLADGWQPKGDIIIKDGELYQALVKYEEASDAHLDLVIEVEGLRHEVEELTKRVEGVSNTTSMLNRRTQKDIVYGGGMLS